MKTVKTSSTISETAPSGVGHRAFCCTEREFTPHTFDLDPVEDLLVKACQKCGATVRFEKFVGLWTHRETIASFKHFMDASIAAKVAELKRRGMIRATKKQVDAEKAVAKDPDLLAEFNRKLAELEDD
jgi:hypothetical protein